MPEQDPMPCPCGRPPGGAAAHRLHERSRFVCEEGRWYYLDGDLL